MTTKPLRPVVALRGLHAVTDIARFIVADHRLAVARHENQIR
jgi:hypothetical protein